MDGAIQLIVCCPTQQVCWVRIRRPQMEHSEADFCEHARPVTLSVGYQMKLGEMQRTGDPLLVVLLFSLEANAFMACRFDVLSGLETGSCMRAAKSALSNS